MDITQVGISSYIEPQTITLPLESIFNLSNKNGHGLFPLVADKEWDLLSGLRLYPG